MGKIDVVGAIIVWICVAVFCVTVPLCAHLQEQYNQSVEVGQNGGY